MKSALAFAFAAAVTCVPVLAQSSNTDRGQRAFTACAPCHSLVPDKNMTGPSLANLWNRQAGTLASFTRYFPAVGLPLIIRALTSHPLRRLGGPT